MLSGDRRPACITRYCDSTSGTVGARCCRGRWFPIAGICKQFLSWSDASYRLDQTVSPLLSLITQQSCSWDGSDEPISPPTTSPAKGNPNLPCAWTGQTRQAPATCNLQPATWQGILASRGCVHLLYSTHIFLLRSRSTPRTTPLPHAHNRFLDLCHGLCRPETNRPPTRSS